MTMTAQLCNELELPACMLGRRHCIGYIFIGLNITFVSAVLIFNVDYLISY